MTNAPDPASQQARAAEERLRAALLGRLLTSSVFQPPRDEYGSPSARLPPRRGRSNTVGARRRRAGLPRSDGLPSLDWWRWRWRWRWRWQASHHPGRGWEPHDPRGFLTRLHQQTPTLAPVALRYVEEALRCFAGGSYLGTSVMIGVASEQAVLIAARAVVAAVSASKLAEKVNGSRAKQGEVLEELRKRLEPMRRDLPDGVADVLTLDAVADLLRANRNEAGHPTGLEVDRDTARIRLQMAAVYLGKLTALTEYFRH